MRKSNPSYFAAVYKTNLRIKIILLVLELAAFIVSIFYLKPQKWDLYLLILSLLALASYLIEKPVFDGISSVRIYPCMHLLPTIAIFKIYGPETAFFVNFIVHIVGLFLVRAIKDRYFEKQIIKSVESVFVFIAVFWVVLNLLRFSLNFPFVKEVVIVVALLGAFLSHLAVETFFSRVSEEFNFKSVFNQTLVLGVPIYVSLLSALLFIMIAAKAIYAVVFWVLLLLIWIIYKKGFDVTRNIPLKAVNLISAITIKNETEEKAREISITYGKKLIHELNIKGKDFDNVLLALILHDFGKAGIDIYSVDSIIEDIKASSGEPLHAERVSDFAEIYAEMPEVADILRYHHKYFEKELFSRKKRGVRLLSSIVNVATTFADYLTGHKDEIYTEKEAFKDLKKDSGWDYDPKVLRALKAILMRQGFKRL